MLKVGSKFYTFDELSRRLEEFQQFEQVQLWVRDSRTVVAAAKRARRKSLNPALKYAELTYSCVFGGRRPSDQTKTHNQTSAGGCPFKVRLSTSNDGQALVVKEICHDHNHEPGKKLHEEPRRLYRNKANNKATVRKQVRCIVNKQRTDSRSATPTCLPPKSQHIQTDTGVAIRLAQSPFHHLQLHNQQQQLQIKLQLEQHLHQQRIKQQQLEEVIQLDSPDHIDTPDHLCSPDLSSSFESLGNLISSAEQYSYLPPSPISPSSLSSSSQAGYTSEEESVIEPIVDLDVALEEALGELDSVSSMDLEDKFSFVPMGSRKFVQSSDIEPSLTALPISSSPSTSSALASHHEDDPCAPPPTKRFKGRPRKQSFTGNQPEKEEDPDFIGFSPVKSHSQDESPTLANTSVDLISEQDIIHANNMAKQLHVYKPGIDFVPGSKLEVLDARDNKWYHCKIVEIDWGELDILVHYERWSVRFDEWLKMDSTRIRPLSLSKKDKSKQFKIGEKILGFWSPDSNYYLGEIIKIPYEDHYEVLFYDGYTKSLRSSQIKKIVGRVDIESYMSKEGMPAPLALDSTPSTPEVKRKPSGTSTSVLESPPPTPGGTVPQKGWAYEPEVNTSKVNIFDVEILEAKRKTKRKPDVEELFKSLKRKRKLEEMLENDFKPSSPMRETNTLTPEAKHQRLQETPKKLDLPAKQATLEKPELSSEPDESSSKVQELSTGHINLREFIPQKTQVKEAADLPSIQEEKPIRSDSFFEINLGDNWKKIARRRPNSSNWDIFYVSPSGTKINNRLQFAKNAAKFPCPISVEYVDFSYRTAKLEFEAKYGGVLIKQDPGTSSATSEASFSEIYEPAAVPFGGKKIKFDSKELVKNDAPEAPQSDNDAESSSSSSSSSTEEDNDDTTDSEEAEEKERVASSPAQVADDRNSSSCTDEYSDSEIEYRNENVPSVKLSEFMPEAESKSTIKENNDDQQKVAMTLSGSIPSTGDAEEPSASSTHETIANSISKGTRRSSMRQDNSAVAINKYSKENVVTPVSRSTRQSMLSPTIKKGPLQNITPSPSVSTVTRPNTRRHSIDSIAVDVSPKSGNDHQCPKKSCEKSFRKENLLHMHMKHYHPELIKKERLNAPNVADLAYARTVGENPDSVSSSPSSSFTLPSSSSIPSDPKSEIQTRKSARQSGVGLDNKKPLTPIKEQVRKETKRAKALSECSSYSEMEDEFKEEKNESESETSSKIKAKKKIGEKIPASIYSDTYSLRTRKSDSICELAENEDETADGAGESQTEGYEEAIINCGCKSTEEDGLMLQCDTCCCWQHAGCYNISETQVPDSYTCSLCENPRGQRSSMRFRYNQDWLKHGKLPRFSFSTDKPNLKLQSFVKRGHELSANVLQLTQLIHSLRLKLSISKLADHPKFVMWHKNWDVAENKDFALTAGSALPSQLPSNSVSDVVLSNQINQDGVHASLGNSDSSLLESSSVQQSCDLVNSGNTFLENLPVVSQITGRSFDSDVITNDHISTASIFNSAPNVIADTGSTTAGGLEGKEFDNIDSRSNSGLELVYVSSNIPSNLVSNQIITSNLISSETPDRLQECFVSKPLINVNTQSDTSPLLQSTPIVIDKTNSYENAFAISSHEKSTNSLAPVVQIDSTLDASEINVLENKSTSSKPNSETEIISPCNETSEKPKYPGHYLKETAYQAKILKNEEQPNTPHEKVVAGNIGDLSETGDIKNASLETFVTSILIDSKSTDMIPKDDCAKHVVPVVQRSMTDLLPVLSLSSTSVDNKTGLAISDDIMKTSTILSEDTTACSNAVAVTLIDDSCLDSRQLAEFDIVSNVKTSSEILPEVHQTALTQTSNVMDSKSTKLTTNNFVNNASSNAPVAEVISLKTITDSSNAPDDQGNSLMKITDTSYVMEGKPTDLILEDDADKKPTEADQVSLTEPKDISCINLTSDEDTKNMPSNVTEVHNISLAALIDTSCLTDINSSQSATDSKIENISSVVHKSNGSSLTTSNDPFPITELKSPDLTSGDDPKNSLTVAAEAAVNETSGSMDRSLSDFTTDGFSKNMLPIDPKPKGASLAGIDDSSNSDEHRSAAVCFKAEVKKKHKEESSPERVAEEIEDETSLILTCDRSSSPVVASTSAEESQSSRDPVENKSKEESDSKFSNEDAEVDNAVSLGEDADDFDLELGGLGTAGVSGMNDGADLAELLSHSSLAHFVDQSSKELPIYSNAPIIPQAERIEPANCKLNLLHHVEAVQNHVFRRFDFIEKELNALEAEMGLTSAISKEEEELLRNNECEERDAATLQSRALVQLILKDLDTLKKIADFSDQKEI